MDPHGSVACLGDFLAGEHSPDVQESMHNNSLGAATAAAEAAAAAAAARRTSLEAALAEQHAAQLSGLDVPMLDDLLPLEDLHDPFLGEWATSHALPLHSTSQQQQQRQQRQQQQQQEAGCQPRFADPHMDGAAPRADPSDPGSGSPFSPAATGLYGIPAYAEPECPAAAMLNNAGPGQVPALVLGPMSVVHPTSAAAALACASLRSRPPGLPLAPGDVAVFGQQHAYAAVQVQAVAAAALPPGLPPAIAAAQQRAATTAVQMQLAAQQHGQPAMHLKPVLVQLPVQPTPQAQQADKPSYSDGAAGGSRCSNASNASTRQTAAMPRNSSESSGNQLGATDAADDAGGPTASAATAAAAAAAVPGAILLPISAVAAGSPPSLSAATGITFTAGTTTAAHAASGGRAPAKRGGRPREKKSYDALIDPGLPIEEVRRLRRMLSNRESARRSRSRRQTQLSGLEEELEQLKSDKERLQSELHHTSSFAQQLSAEKQQLLAEVERLRCQLAAVSTSSPTAAAAAQQQQAPASTMGPAVPPGSSGRLPPLIEKAQRLARQLNQPRVKEEGGAGGP